MDWRRKISGGCHSKQSIKCRPAGASYEGYIHLCPSLLAGLRTEEGRPTGGLLSVGKGHLLPPVDENNIRDRSTPPPFLKLGSDTRYTLRT